MKVKLTINYRTQWGESVYVCGNTPVLGSGSIEQALKLEPVSDSDWVAEFDVKELHSLEYSYLIKTEHGVVLRREWGKRHTVAAVENASSVVVYDNWQDLPDDAPFYSTAFTKGIFSRKQSGNGVAASGGDVVLSVFAPMINSNQLVAVVGEGEQLGGWDVHKAKPLNGSEFPKWSITLHGVSEALEYKFVILNASTKGLEAWEYGNNRLLEVEQAANEVTVLNNLVLRNPMSPWRGAGTAIPVFSLRSADDFGVGDFYDLFKLIDWAEATGQKVIQLLPINDTTMTRTWLDSYPYNANSTFALHPMYIRPDAIGELEDKAKAEWVREKAAYLNGLAVVDYEEVNKLKETYVKALYAQMGEKLASTIAYRTFVKNNLSWLKPYAAYCVLRDQFKTADFNRWGEHAKYQEEKIDAFV